MKNFVFLSILLFISTLLTTSNAQTWEQYAWMSVHQGNHHLVLPVSGGLDNPQFSAADLNQDGKLDLVIFDRTGSKFLTFINHGAPGLVDYTYAPEFEKEFPLAIQEWAFLRDYNCDGIPDIFCASQQGLASVRVYRSSWNSTTGHVEYVNAPIPLCYNFGSFCTALYCARPDISIVDDIDSDGDLDILSMEVAGGFLTWYRNMRVEDQLPCDSLRFTNDLHCWGKAGQTLNLCWLLGQNCRAGHFDPTSSPNPSRGHSGNTLCAVWQMENDTLPDILNGSVSYDSMVRLINHGTLVNALIDSQDCSWPSYDHSVYEFHWPAAYYLDINNDNRKDVLVSPNAGGTESFRNVWWYKDYAASGLHQYHYECDTAIVGEMIDVGTNASPTLIDVDADGHPDLLVGNEKYFDTTSSIAYYRNAGADTMPDYRLVTRDWLQLSALNLYGIHPTFGDLDNDGDQDMIIGNQDGALHYFQNSGGAGNPFSFPSVPTINFYSSIDVGQYSAPQLVDVDGDNDLDLIIGNKSGKIYYYKNSGTPATPNFVLENNFWGGVDCHDSLSVTGYNNPLLIKMDSTNLWTLFVGCDSGTLYQYDSLEIDLDSGIFHRITRNYGDFRVGNRSVPFVADINGDSLPEFFVGTGRGGIAVWGAPGTTPAVPNFNGISEPEKSFEIFPNPAGDAVQIVCRNQNCSGRIIGLFDLGGRLLKKFSMMPNENQLKIDVSVFSNGIYLLKMLDTRENAAAKLIVIH